MKVKVFLIGIIFMSVMVFGSCKVAREDNVEKIKDLEYTVLESNELPEIVATKIEAEKAKPFKFSYTDGKETYIAIGFGEQPTGGFSIQVTDLYQAQEYIVINATLIGPSEKDLAVTVITYPYIVIKTENLDLPVCFK
ncbi:MAG: hypothetical protein CVV02_00235 [Firmicutes bacterium HGW-Firmicutes-7]|nr:MAG: hypothetical protein CVV02_00235 [Firmicutes bacterium HGW-Firmicutes-7]